ncbi:MAG TPA: right-handed parallel beta-helix repeat-containing protein, partial [Elusimicrobiota bacterium]|nr:right-handed parallel beta-helix repeat-containing protein [Elusimicrobiota bacterium]
MAAFGLLVGGLCAADGWAATPIAGNLSGTLTLSGSPYEATGSVTVPAGQTLAIEPGVLIMMSPNTTFTVDGALLAPGASAAPIIFSSLQEGTTQAAPGQWGALQFNNSTSATQLSYTIIRFGQQVQLSNASPQLNQVTISSMSIVAVASDLNSFPSGAGNSTAGCPLNGIDLAAGTISQNGTWALQGIPYVIRSGSVNIGNGSGNAIVTVAPGAVIKLSTLQNSSSRLLVQDTLSAVGTDTAPITFTSIRDSTVGGVTDLFEGPQTPKPGDWSDLQMQSGPSSLPSRLEHVIVRYGGATAAGEIYLNGYNASVLNSTVTLSNSAGIYGPGDGGGEVLTNDYIAQNAGWGIDVDGLVVTISSNTFESNGGGLILESNAGSPLVSSNSFSNTAGIGMSVNMSSGSPLLVGNTFHHTGSDSIDVYPNNFPQDGGGNAIDATNNIAGIDLRAGTWSQSGAWNFTSMPYVIRSGSVNIGNGSGNAIVTVAPGAVIKLSTLQNSSSRLLVQ